MTRVRKYPWYLNFKFNNLFIIYFCINFDSKTCSIKILFILITEHFDLPSELLIKPYWSFSFIIILIIEEKSPSFGIGFDREPGFSNEDCIEGGEGGGENISFSVQFRSVPQSCLTLYDPMEHSMPGSHVHYQLLELAQTHVHWVIDAIQPSHPLSSPSTLAFNLSQHQGLFKWVSSSHQLAKVLEFQLQHQSFQWTLRTELLWTPQFKSISSSVLSFLYRPTLTSIHDY